ncbi:hypothetical protein OSB04_009412 [Centaurea solstitialis]|uniref:FAF domain-containing protein n=1 Tax=Centaurea solstitialis TaxID=347529 RepID=A0AA38TQH1_9ASTR|nr:hypothetical protein OSB04_009412 [Centaurea solstitialis]
MRKPPLNDRNAMSLESLSTCTEGVGFESFYDVEDQLELKARRKTTKCEHAAVLGGGETGRRSRINGDEFPPPISSLGRNGKPWVWLKSYRENGRFILKEVRIQKQESLHASREDGRLKLKFIQFHDDDNDEVIV